ncbi:MAG: hypothetical protein J7K40_09000 [candidate division Zixibacteria bacterium]|nr:hypothetical protein [candidate division Zixibacteria bacterium]
MLRVYPGGDIVTFESKIDRDNENRIVNITGKYLRNTFNPTPKYFPADFISDDKKIYLEVRCRSHARKEFPDIVLSTAKYVELLKLKFNKDNPRVYFIVAWTDCIGLIEIDFGERFIIPFKRTLSQKAGNTKFDVVVSIPISEFKTISYCMPLEKSGNWVKQG